MDYGIIGNCKSAALVKKNSSIEWLCLPQFDSPSVFGKILDENIGGSFEIIPDELYNINQKYIENTNILTTYFKNKGFTYTQLRFERDLDSWKMNFSWVPFSVRESWYFFIGIKSGFLSHLKYDKRKEPDKRL